MGIGKVLVPAIIALLLVVGGAYYFFGIIGLVFAIVAGVGCLVIFGPELLAGIGMAAEVTSLTGKKESFYEVPGTGKTFRTKEQADKYMAKMTSAATTAAKAATTAAQAATTASARPAAPASNNQGSSTTTRLKILTAILAAMIALYFILLTAGLNPIYNLVILSSVFVFITISIIHPPFFTTTMKIVGSIALTFGCVLVFLIMGRFGLPAFVTTAVMALVIVAVFATWNAKIGILVLLLNLLVFTLLLGPPASIDYPPFNKISYTQMFRAESPLYLAAEQQKVIFEKGIANILTAPETIKEGGTSAQQALKRQILIATGEYETGVEAQSSAPLGVFLERTGVTSPRVTIGTPIDLYSELTAQAFKSDELLEVKLGCYGKTLAGKKIEGTDGEIQPQNTFELAELESYPIDCILDSTKIAKTGQSAAKATLEATFDFSTGAFLKGHFMPQEVIRDYTRQGKQPLTEFGITGKDITATYTAGPLRVGMGLGKQPVPILPNAAFGPTLGITFENNWPQGKFQTFKKLVITAPPGLEIKSIDGQDVTGKCKRTPQKEHTCTFQGEADVVKFFPDKIYTKTLRVQTQGQSADELLSGAPLAIRSFKVDVTYTYQIHTDVDITILPVVKT